MASTSLFTAVSSSTRQMLLLLRCISFSKKAQVRISADGLHFSTEEGSVMESVVFLEKSLFTSYSYNGSADADPPTFEISLSSLLEALNIFSLSDPSVVKRIGGGHGDFDAFAAHRLHRHAGLTLGVTGICSFHYSRPGAPLEIHMAESGVTTSCELTTYATSYDRPEEIPFDRENLALKSIMRSNFLLDAVSELAALNPADIIISASSTVPLRAGRGPAAVGVLSVSAAGALGEAIVDFSAAAPASGLPSSTASSAPADITPDGDTRILETFHCPTRMRARYKFGIWKAAQRAMAAAAKVSLRVDVDGVLSLQFLVEVDVADGGDGIAFVDFRAVPLVDEDDGNSDSSSDDASGNNI